MSNKLKTLSAKQLEDLISEAVGNYLDENCTSKISGLSTPNINSEENEGVKDERTIRFNIELSYQES